MKSIIVATLIAATPASADVFKITPFTSWEGCISSLNAAIDLQTLIGVSTTSVIGSVRGSARQMTYEQKADLERRTSDFHDAAKQFIFDLSDVCDSMK